MDPALVGNGEAASLLEGAREVAARLRADGHRALFVGGCVRDLLLGLPIKDIDIATDARPEEVVEVFPDSRLVGAKFGVVLTMHRGHQFEIATFRADGRYIDHRHPLAVSYGTIEDDARRRDFTINALYQEPDTGRIIDLAAGEQDLRARLIRCVGEPRERFKEDALRLLRAVRFAARFDFQIEAPTRAAMEELAPTIQYISAERQRDELTAMLAGNAPARALSLLDQTGLLEWLLPEVSAMKGVEQGKEYHPEGDVYAHTLRVLENLQPRTAVNAWAALLHDVGKPSTFQRDPASGKITFYEHQAVGARIACQILERFRFSGDETEAICAIVERHMQFMHVRQMRESTLRRFIGSQTIESDLAVHRADCLASHGVLDHWQFVRDKMGEFANRREPIIPKPLLSGDDLIALGYAPGPLMGRILRQAQELQLEGELRTKEEALYWARSTAFE